MGTAHDDSDVVAWQNQRVAVSAENKRTVLVKPGALLHQAKNPPNGKTVAPLALHREAGECELTCSRYKELDYPPQRGELQFPGDPAN